MKVEVIEKESQSKDKFPCLMKYTRPHSLFDGSIFYATREQGGLMEGFFIGKPTYHYVHPMFLKPVVGKVVLENE